MNTLGLDLGTSELKALVMSADGAVLATAGVPLAWRQPHAGWAEQDAQDWWRATIEACAQLKAVAPQALVDVRAIGLSGQMHGAVLLDAAGRACCGPAILWNDTPQRMPNVPKHSRPPTVRWLHAKWPATSPCRASRRPSWLWLREP